MRGFVRLFQAMAIGAFVGAVVLGAGGRVAMRILAMSIERPTGFSIGGSLEVIAYGAFVGLAGGALMFLLATVIKRPVLRGFIAASLIYPGAVLTLPSHIVETAAPFAGRMWLVHFLFGGTFLIFSLTLSALIGMKAFAKAGNAH